MLSLFETVVLVKRLRKRIKVMAKRMRSKGKSARHGRAPSPYQKYDKKPYQYSTAYYDWKRRAMAGKANTSVPIRGDARSADKRTHLQAAE